MNSQMQLFTTDTGSTSKIFTLNNMPQIFSLLLLLMLPISISIANVLLFCIVFSWVCTGDLKSKLQIISHHPIAKVALLLFGLFVFGTLYSDAPWHDMHDTLRRMAKLLFIPILIPLFQTAKWRRWALWAFVFAMISTLILSFLKMYGGLAIVTRHTEACVFKNHIETNLMMGLAAFILGHLALEARPLMRYILFGIIFTMTFYILGLSEGRTGYVIFVMLWLLFLYQRFSFKFILSGVLLLAAILGIVALKSQYFQDRMNQLYNGIEQYIYQDKTGDTNAFLERMEFINESFTLCKLHPWQGSGTGSFKILYQEHALKNHLAGTHNPHNEYLNIGVQLGVLGLLGFFIFFWTIFKTSLQCMGMERYIVPGLILAMIIGCLANSWLMDFTPGYLFMVLIAICFGGYSVRKDLMHHPFISVIVTTYNWPQALKAVLLALSRQNYQGFEIVVADDGSTQETANLIENMRSKIPVQVRHVFQADEGFRAAKIRNKAIQAARGDYIIFLDGDCVPRPSFLKHHLHLAQKGKFVVGNRVLLNKTFTQEVLTANLPLHHWSFAQWIVPRFKGSCNRILSLLTLPLGPLRMLNANDWQGAKGCNLGVWKSDLQCINGWEERFQGWGYEDSDLVIRLIRADVKRKSGRYATAVIHLWHRENDRTRERDNWSLLSTRFNEEDKSFVADNGLNQYQGL